MDSALAVDGYAVIERFLEEPLVAAARRDVELALEAPAVPGCERPHNRLVPLRLGDALVLDYRLLHGTHPNASPARRDCVPLSFAPSWAGPPTDVRAHLIRHPALPAGDERVAPAAFAVHES